MPPPLKCSPAYNCESAHKRVLHHSAHPVTGCRTTSPFPEVVITGDTLVLEDCERPQAPKYVLPDCRFSAGPLKILTT